MPYVNIKVTAEGGPEGVGPGPDEKALLIKGVTKLLQDVLNKAPETTFVVVDTVEMESWGMGGLPVTDYRASKNR